MDLGVWGLRRRRCRAICIASEACGEWRCGLICRLLLLDCGRGDVGVLTEDDAAVPQYESSEKTEQEDV